MKISICGFTFLILFIISCSTSKDPSIQLPMYGRLPRTAEQLKSDSNFIERTESRFDNRQEASGYYSEIAWNYYTQKSYSLAMKRFNQAWLLDSLNCQPYWGFGALVGMNKQWNESNELMFRAIKYGCSDALIYQSITSNYFALFDSIQDPRYIDSAFTMVDYGLILNPYNARIAKQKSICFYYSYMPDSAMYWADYARSIDPSSVSFDYFYMIENMKLRNENKH